MLCLNGQLLRRDALHNSSNARFLMDSMFEFAERLNSLALNDAELGLFCAVVVIAAGRRLLILFLLINRYLFPFLLLVQYIRSTWIAKCRIGRADAIEIAFRLGECVESSPPRQGWTLPGTVAQNS